MGINIIPQRKVRYSDCDKPVNLRTHWSRLTLVTAAARLDLSNRHFLQQHHQNGPNNLVFGAFFFYKCQRCLFSEPFVLQSLGQNDEDQTKDERLTKNPEMLDFYEILTCHLHFNRGFVK